MMNPKYLDSVVAVIKAKMILILIKNGVSVIYYLLMSKGSRSLHIRKTNLYSKYSYLMLLNFIV